MKKLLLTAVLLTGLAAAQSAPVTAAPIPGQVAPVGQKQVNIAVGNIQCASYNGCDGQMLADALTNALMQSDRFAVYERAALGQGTGEQMLQGGDVGTQVQGADVIVTGAVTSFGQDSSAGNACFLGVCLGSKNQRIAVNLRIFDVKTSRVIGTAQAEGQSNGSAGSLDIAGLHLGGSQNSGMEKAIAAMLNDAVQKLSVKIPASYYR